MNNRWKIVALAGVVASVLLTAGSCEAQQLRDLENVPVEEMQNVRIFVNVDGYANMVVGCIEGAAFVFTTRDYEAFERQPDLDGPICGSSR
jgi:outer membrane lipoprotein SlyB